MVRKYRYKGFELLALLILASSCTSDFDTAINSYDDSSDGGVCRRFAKNLADCWLEDNIAGGLESMCELEIESQTDYYGVDCGLAMRLYFSCLSELTCGEHQSSSCVIDSACGY